MAPRLDLRPGAVVLICEECDWRIDTPEQGYLCVDALAASQQSPHRNRYQLHVGCNGAPITLEPWHIYHADCDPNVDPDGWYYVREIATSADLLAATAQMLRLPWIGETNWPGTLRRVLADTAGQAGMAKRRPAGLGR